MGQEVIEKRIYSKTDDILIEFDLIDHIELFNHDEASGIWVRAEGSDHGPNFKLEETDGHVRINDYEVPLTDDSFGEDKACILEPNYASYRVYVPKDKTVFISFLEGNFYSNGFEGELSLKAENGLVKLKDCQGPVHISLHTGSIFVRDIQNTNIDSATNMGVLVNDIVPIKGDEPNKELHYTLGNPDKTMFIRTTLANIYLYGSKE